MSIDGIPWGVSNWGVYRKSTKPRGNSRLRLNSLNLNIAIWKLLYASANTEKVSS